MALDVKKVRITIQCVFFFLFLFFFVLTRYSGSEEVDYPVKVFLDMDPLIFFLTSITTRRMEMIPYLAVMVVVLTFLFGRVFCGWICPLGAINDVVSFFNRRRNKNQHINLHWFKYSLLVFLIVTSLFSVQIAGFFDPLALLVRSFTVSIYPIFVYAVDILFSSFQVPFMLEFLPVVREALRETVIPIQPVVFKQELFMGIVFGSILALNFVRSRFWCRYVCPLGGLLGLISFLSPLKLCDNSNCSGCGRCEDICPGKRDTPECYMCGNCLKHCPEQAIRFCYRWQKPHFTGGFSSRRLVITAVSGILVFPFLNLFPRNGKRLLRPPGAVERDFLRRCVKCGACMKVCPTNGLQPAFFESGLEGLWTPILYPRLGYCEYLCTLCGQVCPTGAIRRLPLEEKKKIKIGIAVISKDRCLPYALSVPCIVCEEVCPVSKKAIKLETVRIRNGKGDELVLKRPVVDTELCVGCGMCENKCPARERPAIEVFNVRK